jgi:GNAT superfamily N-acetyltransferase
MPTTVASVRNVDLAREPDLRRWHDAAEAAHRHDRPDAPFGTADEAVLRFRPDDPEERYLPFVAEDGAGHVVGAGLVTVPLVDNLDKVYVELSVTPAQRGRGVGDLLVERALDLARAHERSVLVATSFLPVGHDPGHPVRRFAERHGFALANQEVRRTLHLPLPEETIQGWVDDAAEHHAGYEIVTYLDPVPEELQPSLVELLNLLAVDAPTGDIDFEAGGMTVGSYRHRAARVAASGRKVYETVAVRDGAVVAQSTLSVPPGDDAMPYLNQWGTFVHREHRGHRLGLAVKAASLLTVQRAHPERTVVTTTNSPVNAPMVAINELMGFRPVEVMAEFLRRI